MLSIINIIISNILIYYRYSYYVSLKIIFVHGFKGDIFMNYKFLAFSLFVLLAVSAAEAKVKPENELKGTYPHNNPWDPRFSSDQNKEETVNEQQEREESSEQSQPEAR